jgi:hypothetical protein
VSTTFDVFTEEAVEGAARDLIALDEPRALLDRFVTLVRESGTPDEEAAARYIVARLQAIPNDPAYGAIDGKHLHQYVVEQANIIGTSSDQESERRYGWR